MAVEARGRSNTCEWRTAGNCPVNGGNPKRALSNLLERDRLFTERLQVMVETTGLPAVKVDGRLTEDALENCIARKFGLDGRGSCSGP